MNLGYLRSQVRLSFLLLLGCLCLLCACNREPSPTKSTTSTTETNLQIFTVRGVVKELQTDGKTVVIRHEEVPNYMPAMTMPFEVKDTNELRNLKPGDAVVFEMVVASYDAWISHIHVTNATTKSTALTPSTNIVQLPKGVRVVRDVDPLSVGDELLEYHFTNQLGQVISTRQFKGQALAFTFFFTRCPYPNFCPRLSSSFMDAQKKLLATPDAPTNWHLISISFDTEIDTPEQLKSYAERYTYDPAHWSFVTGDLTEITAIADQVGETFGHDETGSVNHNLRTVVVDARGRIQKIWTDTLWSGEDLAPELIKAANAK